MVAKPTPFYEPIPREERLDRHLTPERVSASTDRERLFAIVNTVRQRDLLTFEHARRVAIYAQRLARMLGYARVDARQFALAGMLHDAGKIWIPSSILEKTGPLTPTEYDRIREHVIIGEHMAEGYDLPEFYRVALRHHHEAYNGSGYPDNLHGEAIPLVARLLAVVDAFDVITSERPYKKAATLATALAEIEQGLGQQFDPMIGRAFIKLAQLQPNFLVAARLCVVPWNGPLPAVWYQVATGY